MDFLGPDMCRTREKKARTNIYDGSYVHNSSWAECIIQYIEYTMTPVVQWGKGRRIGGGGGGGVLP